MVANVFTQPFSAAADRQLVKTMTLEEMQAELDAQNAELANLGELAASMGGAVAAPRDALKAIEEATELGSAAAPAPPRFVFALRA